VPVATPLLAESTQENVLPVRRPALTGHGPGIPPSAVLALDLGQQTGWAVRNADGAIASGKIPYRGVPVATIKRHVTGRSNADTDTVIAAVHAVDIDPADDEADAIALLHWALKTGGPR
jgi:hypothetical protein